MTITSDWHIHSRNSCDGACMTISDLISAAKSKGGRDYGLTDHIHTPFNLPDLSGSLKEFLANTPPPPDFHFAVEVSCVSQWEIDQVAAGKHNNPVYGVRSGGPANGPLTIGLDTEDIATYQIEYIVGGTHWPMYVPNSYWVNIKNY